MSITQSINARLELPSRLDVLWPLLVAWASAMAENRRIRRAEREMHALSDRVLRDIGLARSEIPLAVRGQHRSGC